MGILVLQKRAAKEPCCQASASLRKRRGFALVLALVIMSLLVLTLMAFVTFLSIEIQLSGLSTDKEKARLNGIAASRIAVAELQARLGRDRAATLPGDAFFHAGWTYSASPDFAPASAAAADDAPTKLTAPVPLVSGSHFLESPGGPPFGWLEIASAKNVGEKEFPAVRVPWLVSGADRFAFWIQDEAQKADAGTVEAPGIFALKEIQTNRQLASSRHSVDTIFNIERPDLQTWRRGLSLAIDWGMVELSWRKWQTFKETFPLSTRLFNAGSWGVLADARNGGLRINWDQRMPEKLTPEKLPCTPAVWEEFFERSTPLLTAFVAAPQEGLAITPATVKERALRRFPILSGLRVRIGVFHAHNDAYNRVRFHSEVQLWNPYPYPLTCVEKDFVGLLDFETAPTLTVSNLNTGNTLEVNMAAFPLGKFAVPQTESDFTMNANLLFLDTTHPGIAKQGLLSGEVYNFFMPDPTKQPEGLARTISGTKWYVQSDPKKPNTPPAGATNGNWIHATHTIEIQAKMPASGVTLHIREAKGKFSTNTYSKDYSQPVLTLKNLPFKDFQLRLTGEQFDRPTSTTYTAAEARFAFALRLRPKEPERVIAALEKLDPREPVLDFSDPDVASLFEVITDVAKGKDVALTTSPQEGFLWDAAPNKHLAADVAAGSYSDARALDRPSFVKPLSVGVLRHLPIEKTGAGSLNLRYPASREKDADWFDRVFFAGAWPVQNGGESSAHWTRNPWLEARIDLSSPPVLSSSGKPLWIDPLLATREDAAAHCVTRGVFNVNTRNEEVWQAALARAIPDWKRRPAAGVKVAEPKMLKNVLPRLPYGMDQPFIVAGKKLDLNDEEVLSLPESVLALCVTTQGFRGMEVLRRNLLAREIVSAVSAYQDKAGRGFLNLREFALSSVLEDAIQKARINEGLSEKGPLPPLSPMRLNPGDILESLLPAMSVRGDTFRVLARGSLVGLAGAKAVADAELIVQRLPDFFDATQPATTPPPDLNWANRVYGRRFKIIYFRWLTPTDPR